jgi:hypothetical protein
MCWFELRDAIDCEQRGREVGLLLQFLELFKVSFNKPTTPVPNRRFSQSLLVGKVGFEIFFVLGLEPQPETLQLV